jgi:hypothetical protein
VLAGIDLMLGSVAVLFPATYLGWVHPHLPPGEHPEDWVVRTGVLWLLLMAVEVYAAVRAAPARWFFMVALLRWMEVPADLAYGAVARGASAASRCAILAAPLFNAMVGWYLLAVSRRLTPSGSINRR